MYYIVYIEIVYWTWYVVHIVYIEHNEMYVYWTTMKYEYTVYIELQWNVYALNLYIELWWNMNVQSAFYTLIYNKIFTYII